MDMHEQVNKHSTGMASSTPSSTGKVYPFQKALTAFFFSLQCRSAFINRQLVTFYILMI
jgi:hypothetical protein